MEGGAGAVSSNASGAGSASSFGSYVTAIGGPALSGASTVNTGMVERGNPGLPGTFDQSIEQTAASAWTTYILSIGGAGANGWLPGSGIVPMSPTPLGTIANNSIAGQMSAQTGARGGHGGAYSSSINQRVAPGPGGIGYGAGGGGNGYYNIPYAGGSSGQVTEAVVVLSSLNAIAVTVGNGGAGGNSSSSSYSYQRGGGGARGCVAVFW